MKLKIKLIERIRNVWRRKTYSTTTPIPAYHDDLFLVEFPKAGVTWLSFLFANMSALCSQGNRDVNFFNFQDFVPDIYVGRHLGEGTRQSLGFRVIKSHSEYNPNYIKVVYLVRDPLDVMISFYNFLTQLGYFKGSFDQFIADKTLGVDAWKRHVLGWMNSPPSIGFVWIRYEDMSNDISGVLRRLLKVLGMHVADNIIRDSIERSTMENMKKSESEYSYGNRPHLNSFQFVGFKKFGRNDLTAAQKAFIGKRLEGLEFLGYKNDY